MLKRRYGISLADYDAMRQQQDDKCAICERDFLEMTYLPHIDHCHTTGKVRGLLCSSCNTYLGYAKDSPKIFQRAINYIEALPFPKN